MKKKKVKTAKEKGTQPPSKPVENLEENKDERFDFGGLPQRDLKKNLGCG